jgi:hypothetical protein
MESTIVGIMFSRESQGPVCEAKPAEHSEDFAQILERQKPASGNERKGRVSSEREEDQDRSEEDAGGLPGCPGSSPSPAVDPPPTTGDSSAPGLAETGKGEGGGPAPLAEGAQGEKALSFENAGEADSAAYSFLAQGTVLGQLPVGNVGNEYGVNPPGKMETPIRSMGSQSQVAGAAQHPQPSPNGGDSIPWAAEKEETPSNLLGLLDRSGERGEKEELLPEVKKNEALKNPLTVKSDALEAFGKIMEGEAKSFQTAGVAKEEGAAAKPLFHIYDRGEAPQQVGQRFIWSLAHGEEKIRLALDPPELGSLYLEIHRDKENVRAVLLTETQAAKTILENHQFEIQKILEKDGFTLEKFDVSVDPQMGSFREDWEKEMDREKEPSAWARKNPGSALDSTSLSGIPRIPGIDRYVDLWV